LWFTYAESERKQKNINISFVYAKIVEIGQDLTELQSSVHYNILRTVAKK